MADEYIRREDALRAVQRQRGANRSPAQNEMLNRIKTDIIRAPAADVAPVVRCKGCKHSWEDIGGLCCGYGPLVDCIVPEDFFCAYGKPKEG